VVKTINSDSLISRQGEFATPRKLSIVVPAELQEKSGVMPNIRRNLARFMSSVIPGSPAFTLRASAGAPE